MSVLSEQDVSDIFTGNIETQNLLSVKGNSYILYLQLYVSSILV